MRGILALPIALSALIARDALAASPDPEERIVSLDADIEVLPDGRLVAHFPEDPFVGGSGPLGHHGQNVLAVEFGETDDDVHLPIGRNFTGKADCLPVRRLRD